MVQPVFISHSSRDKATADAVCGFLEDQGFTCWIAPRNVPPGAKYGEAIVHAIEDALAIVFLFSEHSNASEQVMNEIERAVNKKKAIFPLKLSPIMPSSELEYFISRRHWLDLTLTPLDATLPQLAAALQELVARAAPVVLRGAGAVQKPQRVFVLEATREGERLKLSAYEHAPAEERPVRHYTYLDVAFAVVQEQVESLADLLRRATHQHGRADAATWQALKTHAAALYHQLLTPNIQAQLTASSATDLLLYLNDALVHIPWELLYDGSAFLCRRFNIGRFVSTQQALVDRPLQAHKQTLKMLIVADPQGGLAAAAREGRILQSELASVEQRLQVELRQGPVDTAAVTTSLAQCDVLHYAGHAEYDAQEPARSGLLLCDGRLTAADILRQGKAEAVPALVFCNTCQSGQTTAWDTDHEVGQHIYGLANAFLLAGAQHYIGSFWDIPDEPGSIFAMEFYRALAHSATVGEALQRARQRLVERYGEDSVVWTSYMLYGDPTFQYLEASALPTPFTPPPTAITPGEPSRRVRSRVPLLLSAGTAGVLALVLAVWLGSPLWRTPAPALPLGPESRQEQSRSPSRLSPALAPQAEAYQALEQGDIEKAATLFQQLVVQAELQLQSQGHAGLAAVAWARNDAPQTLEHATQAETLDPEVVYSHVLRGHLLWQQGKTTEAATAYRTATDKAHGLPWQRAVAYNRLGRMSAAQGDTQQALEQYDKALSLPANGHPDAVLAHTNKGYLLATLGQFQEAATHYRQAQQLNPADRLSAVLLQEIERRERATQDRDKQERIDQLVTSLVQAHKEGKQPAEQGDGWTSVPLTLAFLHVHTQGTPSPRAGEEEVLLLRVADALQTTGRVTVLERDILDKILAELKLSASELVDPQVAVRVGRILAARLLATGTLSRRGAEAQLSLRVVETETTRLRAAVTDVLDASLGLAGAADQLAATLVQKLRAVYPLQGRILQATPEPVLLNIGTEQGVAPGMTLQVLREQPLHLEGKEVGVQLLPVGLIEITSVESRLAQARVVEQNSAFEPGWKVQER